MIRPLMLADLRVTLEWRNDESSRVWFHSDAEIAWDDHLAWFLGRPDSDWMFLVESEGEPVAQFGLYDVSGAVAEFGRLLVAPARRCQGFGRAAVEAAVEVAATVGLKALHLEVKGDNAAAIHVYRSAGFIDAPGASHAGSVRMELAL